MADQPPRVINKIGFGPRVLRLAGEGHRITAEGAVDEADLKQEIARELSKVHGFVPSHYEPHAEKVLDLLKRKRLLR